jgi:hypothetical protein
MRVLLLALAAALLSACGEPGPSPCDDLEASSGGTDCRGVHDDTATEETARVLMAAPANALSAPGSMKPTFDAPAMPPPLRAGAKPNGTLPSGNASPFPSAPPKRDRNDRLP